MTIQYTTPEGISKGNVLAATGIHHIRIKQSAK